MTPQEIFDKVATHLFAQGKPARGTNPKTGDLICLYRSPTGLKCAAGCLIPDDMYDPAMEGSAVYELTACGFRLPDFFGKNGELVTTLQGIHDSKKLDYWVNTEAMREELGVAARNFGLSSKILETLSFPVKQEQATC